MSFIYNISVGSNKNEQLHINLNKQIIKSSLAGFKFIDKDTKQHVIYLPALNISAYGETFAKAEEMLRFSLNEYLTFLLSQPMDKIAVELTKYGWKKGMFSKEYSRGHNDSELQNLNAEDDRIERLTLTAA